MNYWPRWIGDWKRKTAHLSAEEKGVYGELLDHCYASEAPLPANKIALQRIAGISTESEIAALNQVLEQFYRLTDAGYVNARVSEEIDKRQGYVESKRAAANKRWGRPGAHLKGNGEHPIVSGSPREPEAKETLELPGWMPIEEWRGWLEMRKSKRAPNSPRALKLAIEELTKLRGTGEDVSAVLRQAELNRWTGLFPVKSRTIGSRAGTTGPGGVAV